MSEGSTSSSAPDGTSEVPDGFVHPAQEALAGLLSKHAYTNGFVEDMKAFSHAVDWAKDQWIFAVMAVEVFIFLCVFLSRRSWEKLAAIFTLNTAALYFLERLNKLGKANWKDFSSQNYFDDNGAFVCAIFGAPMVCCQLAIVMLLLKQACHDVIKVKRAELRKDIKAKSAAEKKTE